MQKKWVFIMEVVVVISINVLFLLILLSEHSPYYELDVETSFQQLDNLLTMIFGIVLLIQMVMAWKIIRHLYAGLNKN